VTSSDGPSALGDGAQENPPQRTRGRAENHETFGLPDSLPHRLDTQVPPPYWCSPSATYSMPRAP